MLISGKCYWAKITGNPVQTQFHNGWSFDLSLDQGAQEQLIKAGIKKSSLKDKGDDRGVFVTFRRDAERKDGTPGKPYQVIDAHNNPWPDGKLVGNGSTLNVLVALNEREYKKEKFLKPSAVKIQVWDLVDFKSSNQFPVKPQEESEAGTDVTDASKKKDW